MAFWGNTLSGLRRGSIVDSKQLRKGVGQGGGAAPGHIRTHPRDGSGQYASGPATFPPGPRATGPPPPRIPNKSERTGSAPAAQTRPPSPGKSPSDIGAPLIPGYIERHSPVEPTLLFLSAIALSATLSKNPFPPPRSPCRQSRREPQARGPLTGPTHVGAAGTTPEATAAHGSAPRRSPSWPR